MKVWWSWPARFEAFAGKDGVGGLVSRFGGILLRSGSMGSLLYHTCKSQARMDSLVSQNELIDSSLSILNRSAKAWDPAIVDIVAV